VAHLDPRETSGVQLFLLSNRPRRILALRLLIQTIQQCGSHHSGIELAEKIKKGQFKTGKFGGCRATMSEMWSAVLAV
jgi:hypothetical protein